jgi:hypothetical protein
VALYNTAFGLIVAIPALIFWRYFRARVDAYLLTLELAAERLRPPPSLAPPEPPAPPWGGPADHELPSARQG